MKFLIFNIAVISALAVLIFDQNKIRSVIPQNVVNLVDNVKKKIKIPIKNPVKLENSNVSTARDVKRDKQLEFTLSGKVATKQQLKTKQNNAVQKKGTKSLDNLSSLDTSNINRISRSNENLNKSLTKLSKIKKIATPASKKNNSEVTTLLTKDINPKPYAKEKERERFMSDKNRKRDLMALVDEMELIHFRSLVD